MTSVINNYFILVQINLLKSKSAIQQQFILNIESDSLDVAFIQEPYCFRGKLLGFLNTIDFFMIKS